LEITIARNRESIRQLLAYPFWKDIIDRFLALVAIAVLSPFLALVALSIIVDSPGSPIFMQERVGKNGRRFVVYKFRTMYQNNDDSEFRQRARESIVTDKPFYKLGEDPRVTRLGARLRKTNLDELLQIINVLKGEMAVIGPRPEIPYTMELYRELDEGKYWKRLSVKPGITGLWQVRGRGRVSYDDMVNFDVDYVQRQSPILDASILLRTIGTVVGRNGS